MRHVGFYYIIKRIKWFLYTLYDECYVIMRNLLRIE